MIGDGRMSKFAEQTLLLSTGQSTGRSAVGFHHDQASIRNSSVVVPFRKGRAGLGVGHGFTAGVRRHRHQIGESLLPSTIHGIAPLLGVSDKLREAGFTVKNGGTGWMCGRRAWSSTCSRTVRGSPGVRYLDFWGDEYTATASHVVDASGNRGRTHRKVGGETRVLRLLRNVAHYSCVLSAKED
jgi:hypothetical protein